MATLAIPASISHRIRDGEPRSFAAKAEVVLQLQYQINASGNYEFCYRTAARAMTPNSAALAQQLEGAPWKPYQETAEFERSLDIAIPGYDTLVYVETFGPHLFWSLTRDAVTTLEDHSDLYGELRYLDGNTWVEREEFQNRFCRQIRFKAKFNSAATSGERHKFSYNVLLRNGFKNMVEYEIDPDIQNPKV